MRRLGALLAGLALALLLGEAALRIRPPRLRVQVVRPGHEHVFVEERGVATWRGRAPEPCPAGVPRVLVVGTSILAGVTLPPEDVFSARLTGACVENHAQAGFQVAQVRARVEALLDARPADLVVVELWPGSALTFQQVGATLYSVPGPPPPLPWLVGRSRLAELVWTSTVPVAPPEDPWAQVDALITAARASARGAPVKFVLPAPLHQPFARTRAEEGRQVRDRKAALGPDLLDLADLFGDTPPEAVRVDPCCHLDAEGHRRLAAAVQPWVDAVVHAPPH